MTSLCSGCGELVEVNDDGYCENCQQIREGEETLNCSQETAYTENYIG